MADLYLPNAKPQTNDSEKLLLARLAAGLIPNPGVIANAVTLDLVPSAARTALFQGTILPVPAWARGVFLRQNTTAASGTGGLKLTLRSFMDAAGARLIYEAQASGFLTTTGVRSYIMHPQYGGYLLSVAAFMTYGANGPLGPYIAPTVVVGDATSYTYSIDLAFVP